MTKLKSSFTMAVIIAAAQMIIGCGLMGPPERRQLQPATVTDFKSVAGKWEGLMVRNPRTHDDDWVTFTISDTGAYEFVSYRMIGVFAGKGKLVLSDGKLSAKSEKGGQMTLQLFTDSGSPERMLRAVAKDGEGLQYWADLKRTGSPAAAR
jgi:hypothetical protein